MDKKKKTIAFIGLAVLIALVLGFYVNQNKVKEQVSVNPNDYLSGSSDIDLSPEIMKVAAQLKEGVTTTDDLIKRTISYTRSHVVYKGDLSVSYCYNEKASDVLKSGQGDCVSMSKLNAALLKANGIPARTVGGCVIFSKSCTINFAIVPGEEIPTAKIKGDGKKRGYLHEWVEVYDGTRWLSIESTTGNIFETGCDRYNIFGYDSNPQDRCVINDYKFNSECEVA